MMMTVVMVVVGVCVTKQGGCKQGKQQHASKA